MSGTIIYWFLTPFISWEAFMRVGQSGRHSNRVLGTDLPMTSRMGEKVSGTFLTPFISPPAWGGNRLIGQSLLVPAFSGGYAMVFGIYCNTTRPLGSRRVVGRIGDTLGSDYNVGRRRSDGPPDARRPRISRKDSGGKVMSINRDSAIVCSLTLALLAVLATACAAADEDSTADELQFEWFLGGGWTGIAADRTEGTVYALNENGKCVELDRAGKTRREFELPDGKVLLRLADWSPEEGRALLAFTALRKEMRAYALDGKLLWSHPRASDMVGATLAGEKPGAVIVGHSGGVNVLDSKGQVRWKSDGIQYVHSVSAGEVWGDGTTQVVTTSVGGELNLFSSDGTRHKQLDVGIYAEIVCVGKISENDKAATIFAAGEALPNPRPRTVTLVALSGDGTRKWSLDLPAADKAHAISATLFGKWLAVAVVFGRVHVIDAEKGKLVGSPEESNGVASQAAWLARKDAELPLLVVVPGGPLVAFSLPSGK
jgi:hypothetical protein